MIELTKEIFCAMAHNILKFHEKVELEGDYRDILEITFIELSRKHPEVSQIFYIQSTVIWEKTSDKTQSGDSYKIVDGELYRKRPIWYLWRYCAWLSDIERRDKITKDRQLYDEVLEERKRMFRDICTAVCDMMGFEKDFAQSDTVKKLAQKIMEKKKASSGELLGVDLEHLRDLPGYHIILDEDGKEDYRV